MFNKKQGIHKTTNKFNATTQSETTRTALTRRGEDGMGQETAAVTVCVCAPLLEFLIIVLEPVVGRLSVIDSVCDLQDLPFIRATPILWFTTVRTGQQITNLIITLRTVDQSLARQPEHDDPPHKLHHKTRVGAQSSDARRSKLIILPLNMQYPPKQTICLTCFILN